MELINELQGLCNFAVTISLNNLMIDWIEFLKTQSNNKSILKTYDSMILKLTDDKFVAEFDDPASISEFTWGIGSKEQFLPIVDIHETYYIIVLGKINLFFANEILILSNDEEFQIKAKNIQTNLQIAFHIPKDVINQKESRNSTFHNLKGKYSTWLNNRKNTQTFLDDNFEKLKKLVSEYS